mgnify:CR=1 FL=1
MISERVRNGLANARAKGKLIGRVRKRNSALIDTLLDAGLSYRAISKIAKCSHGSVHAQKNEYLARKAKEEQRHRQAEEQVGQQSESRKNELIKQLEEKLRKNREAGEQLRHELRSLESDKRIVSFY